MFDFCACKTKVNDIIFVTIFVFILWLGESPAETGLGEPLCSQILAILSQNPDLDNKIFLAWCPQVMMADNTGQVANTHPPISHKHFSSNTDRKKQETMAME